MTFENTEDVINNNIEPYRNDNDNNNHSVEQADNHSTHSVVPEKVCLRLWELHDSNVGEEFLLKIFESTLMTVIIFDLTSKESYLSAVTTYYDLVKNCSPCSSIILVANKIDLGVIREVDREVSADKKEVTIDIPTEWNDECVHEYRRR